MSSSYEVTAYERWSQTVRHQMVATMEKADLTLTEALAKAGKWAMRPEVVKVEIEVMGWRKETEK